MWFVVGAVFLLSAALIATIPRPQQQQSARKDLDIPVAEEGAEIGVGFGRFKAETSIVYYGGVQARAIRQKGGKK